MSSKIIKNKDVSEKVSLESQMDLESPSSTSVASKKILSKQDMQAKEQAQDIVEQAKKDATRIREAAKRLFSQVEDRVKSAIDQGYEQGKEQGVQEMTAAVVQFEKKFQEVVDDLESQSLKLIYDITSKVLGDRIQHDDEALLEYIKQALRSSMGNELTLFVNPDDFERIKTKEKSLTGQLLAMQTLQLKASENVKPSSCVIESEMGSIEADLEKQLEAIKNALGV